MGRITISDRSDSRANNFNLLRMLAATGVLVSHAYPISLGAGAAQPLEGILKGITLGGLCVAIFFAISGFFIARSFTGKPSLAAFVKARALRLFPALMVVLGVTIVAGAALTTDGAAYWAATPEYYFRNLTLFFLQYDLPGVFQGNPSGPAINGSLWTLNYEVLCYLGVVIAGGFGLLTRPTAFAVGLAVFLVAYGLSMVFPLHSRVLALLSLGLPFAVGVSFWVWRHSIPLSVGAALGLLALSVLSWPTPLFAPIFTVSVSYAVFVSGYARLPLLMRYNKLGDYSYGMYVYAFPIQQGVAFFGVSDPVINVTVSAPFTLLCAVISWHFVEAPALKLKKAGATPRPIPLG